MNRLRFSLVRNVLSSSVLAILLLGTPMQLAAQEREAPATPRASAIEWFSGLWSDLTAWFAGGVTTPPRPAPPAEPDNGCAIDPNGGCGG